MLCPFEGPIATCDDQLLQELPRLVVPGHVLRQ
jgi:hypothetical protein